MQYDTYINKFNQMLSLRDLAEGTVNNYIFYLRNYFRWLDTELHKLPEDVSWEELRSYLLYLKEIKGLNSRSVNPVIAQLRFFYLYVLHKDWDQYQIPYQKFDEYLPEVPTKQEVFEFIDSYSNLKHKAMIAILYSSGLRVSELCRLRYCDISRSRMMVYVSKSKNRCDRYAILSLKALDILTQYWLSCGKPKEWLFPGQKEGTHVVTFTVNQAIKHQLKRIGWNRDFNCHSFRHGFGLHLYESGADLMAIRDALGHKSLSSTTIYVSLGIGSGRKIVSPYDNE